MFIGHFAVGIVASRFEKRLPLGTALLASQLPDALWPVFLLAGAETVVIAQGDTAMTPLRFESYPWSHSLLMVALWGAASTFVYAAAGRPRAAAVLLAPLAVSHWIMDFITHRPDMPLVPWGDLRLGLGMWNSVPLTVAVEGLLFAGAVAFYAKGRAMSKSFWALIATLSVVYVGNVLGPPPPSTTAIIGSMLSLVPLVWWWGNKAGTR
jgi:membrane-bound metal-dependent hydrolase YbcI (DUF457 family)